MITRWQCSECDMLYDEHRQQCEQCGGYQCIYQAPYLPTAEEIVAMCAEIRATWSDKEERRRRRAPEKDTIDIVDCHHGAWRRHRSSWREA